MALSINSPGGSPVQSALLFRRIRQLAAEKGVPVFAFAEDVAASGGYWLALAGDEVWAEESSLLGSIGVVTASFGVHRLIERFGVDRRLYTAGERKSLLDPFSPEDPSDVARLSALQKDIHDSFKEHVKLRRAGKIDPADESLFSGEVLTGRMALARGLIDGIGDLRSVMRSRYGDKVRLVPIAHQRRRRWWLPRLRPSIAQDGSDCRARRRIARLGGSAGVVGPLRAVGFSARACLVRSSGFPYTAMTISLPKLILIFIVILAVWYVSRVLNRGGSALERRRRSAAARPRAQNARGQGTIEDLVPCRTCGAYVSPGAHNCGRPACPQPR